MVFGYHTPNQSFDTGRNLRSAGVFNPTFECVSADPPRVHCWGGGSDEIQNFDFREFHRASSDWDTCWSCGRFGRRSDDRSLSINDFEYSVVSPMIF
jgi:hypothetical protein